MSLRMPERHSMGNIFFRLRRTESIRLIRRPAVCWPRSPLQAVAAIRGSRGRKAHCGSGSIVAGKSIKSIPRQVRFSAQSSPTGSSLASPGSMESCGTQPGKVSRVTYVESIRGPGKSWSGWRCRRASTFLGSSPTDAISFSAEEDPPERSGQSVGLGELRERAETLNRRLKVRFLPRSPFLKHLHRLLAVFHAVQREAHYFAMCLRHVGCERIPATHGCADIRVAHQLLLDAYRRTHGVQPSAVSVPKAVSAKPADTGGLRCLLIHAPHMIIIP